jgi:rod shape-determining protein MreB
MFKWLTSLFSKDLAMDLGTANTLIHLRGKGMLLNEPSVVAIDQKSQEIVAFGHEARSIRGRHSPRLTTVRPLKDGVIADFEVTSIMIKHYLGQVLRRRSLSRPRLVVAVPTGITTVEKRAVIEACEQAGAGKIHLIEEPMAAAIGAGLPVDQAVGNMIVDIGGGTTEVAVISMFAVAYAESVRVAGDEANEAIMRYLQNSRQMLISEVMAEDIKIQIGSALTLEEPMSMEIPGKELVSGIPRNFTVTDGEIREAIQEPTLAIVNSVQRALEKTPPDLSADIFERGFWLAGGGALLRGLPELLRQVTGLKVNVADDPLTAIVRGAGTVLEDFNFYQEVFIN